MVKEEFPILSQRVNENRLIYLDNASTTQKPTTSTTTTPIGVSDDCCFEFIEYN